MPNSYLDQWDVRASVRAKSFPYPCSDTSTVTELRKRNWFGPHTKTIFSNPSVEGLPPEVQQKLCAAYIAQFLESLARGEQEIVNGGLLGICFQDLSVTVPDAQRLNAYKIYTDEAYHSLFCADSALQIRKAYALDPFTPENERLSSLVRQAGTFGKLKPDCMFLLAFMTESQVVKDLAEIVKETGEREPINVMSRDHLLDEVGHVHYFSDAFASYWDSSSTSHRDWIVEALSDLLPPLFAPNTAWIRNELRRVGIAESVIDDICEAWCSALSERALGAYPPIFMHLKRAGVFEDSRARSELLGTKYCPAKSAEEIAEIDPLLFT